MMPVALFRFALCAMPAAVAGYGLATIAGSATPVSASGIEYSTVRYTLEVAHPGIVEVRPGDAKVNRLRVVEGQRVAAGEVVAEIDTSDLDREMAALKNQVDATRRTLDAVRLEAKSFGILLEQGLASPQRVSELNGRVAELERSAGEFIMQLATVEQRLANAEVRAPVEGVVGAVMGRPAGEPFGAGDIMLRIATDPSSIVLEGRLGIEAAARLEAAGQARIWLGASSFMTARPVMARLTWRDRSTRSSHATLAHSMDRREELIGVRLEVPGGYKGLPAGTVLVPGQSVSLMLAVPGRTFHQQILDPIRRNLRWIASNSNARS